jgi:hypothetical protein
MTRICFPLLAALLFTIPAPAAIPVPEDFAFGFTVEGEAGGALWQLELPEAVYRGVTRADLGDLRVFNSAGDVVPHTLRLPDKPAAPAPAPAAVPFFPLYTQDVQDVAGRRLRIVTDETGMIVDATSEAVAADGTDRITAYLLDTSVLEEPPAHLTLSWEHSQDASFAVSVDVSASKDLAHWSELVDNMTLADLRYGEAVLVQNGIELPPRQGKYLRITWPEALRGVTLTGVQATFRAVREPLPRRWHPVTGEADPEDPHSYDFDSGGYRPVDRARIGFATRNVVVEANLLSRATPQARWRNRKRGEFYALERADAVLESGPVEFGVTTDRYWRFQLADREQQLAGGPPTLALGWVAQRLTFVAQGEPPYTVAFGSAVTAPATHPVATLLRTLDDQHEKGLIVPAQAAAVFTLGGEEKLRPPPAPFPWKKFMLWAVLLGGVALLAWMVRGLLRQMNRS